MSRTRWLVVLTLLAFGLRAFHMDAQSLWYDEIGSVKVVTTPLVELAGALDAGRVEPTAWLSTAYYALLKAVAWTALGDRDGMMRLTSVVLGTATVPAIAWAATPLVPAPVALAAAAALAISPFHVWYSQEVRPYALLVLLATLTIGAFARARRHGGAARWSLVTLLMTLALYTHPIALALPVICGIVLLADLRRAGVRRVRPGFLALVAAGIAFLPAVLLIRAHGANNPADVRAVGWFDLPYAFYAYAVGFSYGPSTTALHDDRLAAVVSSLPAIVLAAVTFGALVLRGALATRRLEESARLIVWAWLVVPLALALGIALTSANPFNVRYGIVSFPSFVVLIALGAAELRRPLVAALVVAAIGIASVALAQLAFDPHYAKEDSRGLAAALRNAATADDLVIVNASYMAIAVAYYYEGPARVVPYPPVHTDRELDPAKTAADVEALAAERAHVWLIATRTFHGDQEGILPRALGTRRAVDRVLHVPGIVATRYTKRPD